MNLHGNINIFINEKMIYCILAFSLIIRILKLEEIPPGFYVDEVVFGYDAYSLITTGRDSDGNLLPIYFRHLGTYVDPIYVYSIIPLILLFGNTIFSVRFTSVLYGVMSIFTTYLFVKEAFNKKLALLTSLFLALSPWHFFFSRVGFQCISFTFYFTLSLYFLLKSLQNKPRFLYLGFIILGISIYTYFVSRLFIPLFILGFIFIYRKKLLYLDEFRKYLIWSFFIFFIIITPFIYNLVFNYEIIMSRFNHVSIFRNGYESMRIEFNLPENFSRYLLVSLSFVENYISHISPTFLFFEGDPNPRHSLREFGQLYLFQSLPILFGIFVCIKERREIHKLLIFWLAIYSIPASLTYEGIPHAVRTITALPLFEIFTSIGLSYMFTAINKDKSFALLLLINSILLSYNVIKFFNHYFSIYSVYAYPYWNTKFNEVVIFLENVKNSYRNVFVEETCLSYP